MCGALGAVGAQPELSCARVQPVLKAAQAGKQPGAALELAERQAQAWLYMPAEEEARPLAPAFPPAR
ncbi:MAG TPA: hypothetical protein VHD63_28630 [Ktedonobacteraceae bacterium]|nr:hypothetical protein [Ktedonobacteraceae bacterium]